MTTAAELIQANPFPGLRPFAASEVDRFFGRREQVEELVARLDQVAFVAVAGSSGCGKSSLVRAGLLSALAGREAAGGTWGRAAVLRPGNQPIANLAEELAPLLGGTARSEESRTGTLYGRLRLGGLGLVEAVRLAHLDPQVRVLVVVDQFEEIFRFKRMTDADEASAFVKLLLNAARDPDSPVSVVITLRSDALGSCADFRGLPEAINRGQYLVPKLTREQRKEAIVKPVELRGATIAPRLVQRLLNDVSGDFDDLPVMQHALTRTWTRWAEACQGDRPIDLEDYEAVGTTRQALSNHADEAFTSLPGLEPVVEKVFRALTEHVAEGSEIRRPLDLDRLSQVVAAERGQVEQVVERFRRPDTAFMMPPPEVPLATNPVIDISHESLIRLWGRLREWARLEAESRVMLLRLVEAAARHEEGHGSLWQGPDLAQALEWQRDARPTPAWVALYVGESATSAWESAQSFMTMSAEEGRRERWRRKLLIGGLSALALTVVAISLMVIYIVHLAKQQNSERLANQALLEIEPDPARSAHLALAAVDQDRTNPRAEYALRQSLATLETAHAVKILTYTEPVADVRLSRDGTRLLTASGKTVTIYDGRTFEPVAAAIQRDAIVQKAWLIAKNTVLVTQTRDGYAQIQRLNDSTVRRIACTGEGDSVYTATVSPDDRHVALGCHNGRVLVWDATEPAQRKQAWTHRRTEPVTVTVLAFSEAEDGRYLASGDANGVVNVWKLGSAGAWIRPGASSAVGDPSIRHDAAIRDVAFHSSDPGLLVTVSDDYLAMVWSLDLNGRRLELNEKGQPQHWVLKHNRPVTATMFTLRKRDRKYPVVTVSDKRVRLWENETPGVVQMHDDWVNDANISADGEVVVTASADGTARVWSTRSVAPIAVLRGHKDEVTRAVISADGKQVVTASTDRTVRVWLVLAPQMLAIAEHWVLSAAFEPDGTRIAVGEERGRGRVLELKDSAGDSVPVERPLSAALGAGQVSFMSWSRDRKFIAGRGASSTLGGQSQPVLWAVDSAREITPDWLKKDGMVVAFSPGTDELLTIGDQARIAVWDTTSLVSADPRPKLELGEQRRRWVVAMSPDGRWIATDGEDGLSLWARERPDAPARQLKGHQGAVVSLKFSRDSKRLLTASHDRTARIWPINPPDEPIVLSGGHTSALTSASFDPSGKQVVTGSDDNTIRVWDAKTGNPLAALRRHSETVNEVQFHPSGERILSASDDGTVKLGRCEACNLTVEQLRDRVPQLAPLSPGELEDIRRETAVRHPWRLPFLSRDR